MTENDSDPADTLAQKATGILDHVTDMVALGAIAGMVIYSGVEPSNMTLAAITSIALGKRYLKAQR